MAASALTINGGSSSIKFALYALENPPARRLVGKVDRIGIDGTTLSAESTDGQPAERLPFTASDHEQVAQRLIDWLDRRIGLASVAGVGHRVVHGGEKYSSSQRITPALIDELKRLRPLDPNHLPAEIGLIEAFARRFPSLPQVACFDTAFHHDLPRVAQILPVPRRYEAAGVRRYGFHGLSYSYLLDELKHVAGEQAAKGRIIFAHLGAGASMAAVRDGRSIDTTMAFTPTAGLVMATRTGDLDPGLLVYLMRSERMTADQIDDLINRESGLLGVSETSSDMRDLLARQSTDPRAADAVALFCYQAKKWIGALAAALGGLDTLIFAGGIGENAPEVRARICEGLEFLGVRLDASLNAAGAAVISAAGTAATVRVIHTDEELVIIKELQRLMVED